MEGSNGRYFLFHAVLIGLALFIAIGVTGCQSDIGGQTLPSPYYMTDDVQYYPHGTQFKLSREAAAMQAAAAQQQPPGR